MTGHGEEDALQVGQVPFYRDESIDVRSETLQEAWHGDVTGYEVFDVVAIERPGRRDLQSFERGAWRRTANREPEATEVMGCDQLAATTTGQDSTVVDDHDVSVECLDLRQIVRGVDDTRTLGRHLLDRIDQLLSRADIGADGRLVEHEKAWAVDQGTGGVEAASLTS